MMLSSAGRHTVVILNDFGTVNGGAAKVAIESAYGLAGRGHHVSYFCAVGPTDRRLHEAGVEVVCLDQPASLDDPNRARGAVRNLWSSAAAQRLAGYLARKPGGVVHIHGWCKALSPSALWTVRNSGLPAVVTIHDYFLACPNGALFDYRSNKNCPLRPMSAACIARNCDKRSYAMKAFRVLRQTIQNSAMNGAHTPWHFAAVSQFALNKIAPFLPKPHTASILENPADLVRLPPAEPARSNLYLAAGRLSPEKGFDVFAAAAARAGVRATIIGEGECRSGVAAANSSLEMPGWLEHAEFVTRLREARALIFPSLWPETHGLVPLEAAAQGIPPIVSDNTAARDWVVDGRNGLHIHAGDIGALAAALERLKDDALVARLGRAAYDDYWAHAPTLAKHVDALEALYESLLLGRAGRPASAGLAAGA
ncbi:MAG TPA: glycosyltransferase family 4 protein [Rhizomicrobium sp.]|nr:glycosyltransferase family 4 protein [Rhizomicrobium sp.]